MTMESPGLAKPQAAVSCLVVVTVCVLAKVDEKLKRDSNRIIVLMDRMGGLRFCVFYKLLFSLIPPSFLKPRVKGDVGGGCVILRKLSDLVLAFPMLPSNQLF